MDKRIIERIVNVSHPILIVGEDVEQRWNFKQELEQFSFPCETSHNGFDALKKIQGQDFSMLIVNSPMLKMHGHELIIEVRKIKPELPALLNTPWGHEAQYLEGLNLVDTTFIKSGWDLVLAVKRMLLKA